MRRMAGFTCPVENCSKELSRLQVMHFRSAHDCEPSEWVENRHGTEIADRYESGDGSYVIAADYEWLSPDMVCEIVDTRTPEAALNGSFNPMKRDKVVTEFTGDENPAKRPEVREKISSALTGHTQSEETKRKISRKNSGNEISDEHRRKLSEAASNRDTSYMQTDAYSRALSEALEGREPTYPEPYEVSELSHPVRSSWEEDVATLLTTNDVAYEYEPEFTLSVGSYYPDFVVDDCVIEVKGFATERSVRKAKAFMRECSNHLYVAIGDEIPCDVHVPWDEREKVLEVVSDD